MRSLTTSFRNFAVLTLVASTLSACALPRPGPTRSELVSGSTEKGGDAFCGARHSRCCARFGAGPDFGFFQRVSQGWRDRFRHHPAR